MLVCRQPLKYFNIDVTMSEITPNLVVALLRHAEYRQPEDVPSAWLPYPLTEKGLSQARAAASSLYDFMQSNELACLPRIDCSLMLRAWQTADVIANQLARLMGADLGIDEYPSLAERSVGAAANLTIEEIESILAEDPRYSRPAAGWKANSEYKLPFQGAESLDEAGLRVAFHIQRTWHAAMDSGDGGLKIIVGHGASIRHAAKVLGLLASDEVGSVSMYHAEPIFITCEDGKWRLLAGRWKPRGAAGDRGDEFAGR